MTTSAIQCAEVLGIQITCFCLKMTYNIACIFYRTLKEPLNLIDGLLTK